MSLTLHTWYSLDQLSADNERFVARFLPDHTDLDRENPVLTVTVLKPKECEVAAKHLRRFQDEFAVDISLSMSRVEVWGEYDDEPSVVSGEVASHEWSPYAPSDLAAVVRSLQTEVASLHAQNSAAGRQKAELEHFIGELLRRAEIKAQSTAKQPATAKAQLDVLSRVLSHLRGA